jgi:hypothetical protein
MADIDKALTEVKKTVEIAGPEEQVEVQEEITESIPNAGNAEITRGNIRSSRFRIKSKLHGLQRVS